jgi:hypothetical protein
MFYRIVYRMIGSKPLSTYEVEAASQLEALYLFREFMGQCGVETDRYRVISCESFLRSSRNVDDYLPA